MAHRTHPASSRHRTRRTRAVAVSSLVSVLVVVAGCGSDDLSTTDRRDWDETTTTTLADDPGTTTPTGGADGAVDRGVEVEGDGYHGWIIDPDADEGWMFDDATEPVWATPDDVARVEAILADEVPAQRDAETNEYEREHLAEVASRLDRYERQYVGGRTADGAEVVYVNALCTTDLGGDPDRLATSVAMVADGGSCFWNATVDLTAGAVVSLSVNGDA